MCVCRFYSLIIMLFSFDNLKSKFLIKVNRALVTYLNVSVKLDDNINLKNCVLR